MTVHIVKKLSSGLHNICSSQKRNICDCLGSLKVNKYSNSSKIIRTFNDDDLERILEIDEEAFGNKNNPQIIKYSKQFRNIFYVYEINGVIVGYVGYYVHLKREGRNIIQNATAFTAAMSEDMRGKGVFSVLWKESLSELKKNDVQVAYTYVNVNNAISLAVNHKFGFKIVERIDQYYGSDDAYKFEFRLQNN